MVTQSIESKVGVPCNREHCMRKNPDVTIHREKRQTQAHVGRVVSLPSQDKPALIAETEPPPVPALHPPSVDQLKFRLITRRAKHYFKDVRFKGPLTLESISVIKFLEGRCLETLTHRALQNGLGHLGLVPQLETMLKDLRQVLCD
jgi:hypothetical protein